MSKSTPMEQQAKYQNILHEIDAAYRNMKLMRPLPASGVKYFTNEFSIIASHNSNAIEGNTFTIDETRLLLEKGITSNARSFKEHEEIVGYKQGFDFLYNSLKTGRDITEDFIKKIHSYVLHGEEDAGEYRTIQNYIGNLTRIIYTPCAPREVPQKMKEYVSELHKDLEEMKEILRAPQDIDWKKIFHKLAEYHCKFENIHPFIDGNGRTGRLLLTYEMISLGLLPVDIRYEERKRYQAALSSYNRKEKYSNRADSKTEKLAKLLAESELRSMRIWNKIFSDYAMQNSSTEKQRPKNQEERIKKNESKLIEIDEPLRIFKETPEGYVVKPNNGTALYTEPVIIPRGSCEVMIEGQNNKFITKATKEFIARFSLKVRQKDQSQIMIRSPK